MGNDVLDIFNKSYQLYHQYGASELFKRLIKLFQEKDIETIYFFLSEALVFYRRNKEVKTNSDWDKAREDGIQLCKRFQGRVYQALVAELLCVIEKEAGI